MRFIVRVILRTVLVLLEIVFAITRKKTVPPFPYDKKTRIVTLPRKIEKELLHLISTGNKVEAVRRVTRLTGAGLRVSKDYVDNLAITRGKRP